MRKKIRLLLRLSKLNPHPFLLRQRLRRTGRLEDTGVARPFDKLRINSATESEDGASGLSGARAVKKNLHPAHPDATSPRLRSTKGLPFEARSSERSRVEGLSGPASGFSLIEAIVALLIIGVVVGSLFKLQGQLFRGTFTAHALYERIAVIRNAFVRADQEEWYTKSKTKEYKDEGPSTKITYSFAKVSEQSAFKKIKNLYSERIDAEWPELRGTHKDTFISFRFYIEPESQKSGEKK